MLVNTRTVLIEWGHCDPAGIVFFPNYFSYFGTSTVLLFERALNTTWAQMMAQYDVLGAPVMDAKANFLVPSVYGDVVEIESSVTEFRTSSFDVRHKLSKDGTLAVDGRETRLWARRDPADEHKLVPVLLPPDLIKKFEHG